jgi:hypothetical protein
VCKQGKTLANEELLGKGHFENAAEGRELRGYCKSGSKKKIVNHNQICISFIAGYVFRLL